MIIGGIVIVEWSIAFFDDDDDDKTGASEQSDSTCSASGVGKDVLLGTSPTSLSFIAVNVIAGVLAVKCESGLDKGNDIEGKRRGSPDCGVGENTRLHRVEGVMGTGADNEGSVAVGSNSQRTWPTLTT